MIDEALTKEDPQHYPNPNYKGVDFFALKFVQQREASIAKANAIIAARGPEKETEAHITEADVRANIGESNARYAAGALQREILNSYYNHPLILHDFGTGRGAPIPLGQGKGPALIIGSGPSLDDCHDLIKGWRGALFCSTSQGPTMIGLGKRDFYMICVDVKTEASELMPLDIWEDKNVTLITHPGMDPSPIQVWRWNKYYFRIKVHNMPYYTQVQPLAYHMVTTEMYVYGCAIASQISIASMMGYNPLFLCGADFGYPQGRARFRELSRQPDGTWKLGEPWQIKYLRHAKVTYRNGVETDSFQAYYKQTLFNVWRLSLADIFRIRKVGGFDGGLYEVPTVTPEEISATQGVVPVDKYISNQDKIDICERYLLQYNTHTIEFPNGQVEFVVFDQAFPVTGNEPPGICGYCGKATQHGGFCNADCHYWFSVKRYIDMVNQSFQERKLPGVLILGEYKDRLSYLRNDEAWARKEKRWQWEIKLPQLQTETLPEQPLESASQSTETTGKTT